MKWDSDNTNPLRDIENNLRRNGTVPNEVALSRREYVALLRLSGVPETEIQQRLRDLDHA